MSWSLLIRYLIQIWGSIYFLGESLIAHFALTVKGEEEYD